MQRLVDIQYPRNNVSPRRGTFRVQGDTLEVFPPYEQAGFRLEWWGDTVEKISKFDPVTGEIVDDRIVDLTVFPASHYAASEDRMKRARVTIEEELHERLAELEGQSKLLEAERLRMRTSYDLEMMREVGFCSGIENYSRHIDGRSPGTAPYTLLDYFPDDYLVVIDESHVTVPQLGGMYEGDLSRKTTLVEHGFRLPSAIDNRPLQFEEFAERARQVVYMSATPGPTSCASPRGGRADRPSDRARRPRGAGPPHQGPGRRPDRGDPRARRGRPARARHHAHEEDGRGPHRLPRRDGHPRALPALRGRHAQRIEIVRDLRLGEFDVLVGINLLREGLDLPEVSLVAILDADKEGFLRSETSLIQTIGRAARNVDGTVLMYADSVTDSMQRGDRRDPAPAADPGALQRRARHRSADRAAEGHRHPALATRRGGPEGHRADEATAPTRRPAGDADRGAGTARAGPGRGDTKPRRTCGSSTRRGCATRCTT